MIQDFFVRGYRWYRIFFGDTGAFFPLYIKVTKKLSLPRQSPCIRHQTSQTINSINNHGTDTTSTDNTVHRQALWIWSIRLHTDADIRHHIHKNFSAFRTRRCAQVPRVKTPVTWVERMMQKKNLCVAGGRWGTLGLWEWGPMVPGIASTFNISIRIWKEKME